MFVYFTMEEVFKNDDLETFKEKFDISDTRYWGKYLSKISNPVITNNTVAVLITWLVFTNIVLMVNGLPSKIKNTITHPIIQVGILFVGLYTANGKAVMSLGGALAIVAIFYYLKYLLSENFQLVSPESNVHPGCSKVTIEDLIKIFDNDKELLSKAMYACGVPLNLTLNDSNAPLIATYLINSDYKVNETCQPPN